MSEYWFTFARDGKPSSSGAPHWINDRAGPERTMEFGSSIVLKANFMKARLNVLLATTKMLGPLLNRR